MEASLRDLNLKKQERKWKIGISLTVEMSDHSFKSSGSVSAIFVVAVSVCRSSVGLNVVLVHPQIPQNTGCTARSCAAACVPLHLVEPLGFDTDSKKCSRSI